tara:strand:+ start:220 stop:399 length:180 start_codon:yes stop_codon:yes gene_type:complete
MGKYLVPMFDKISYVNLFTAKNNGTIIKIRMMNLKSDFILNVNKNRQIIKIIFLIDNIK